MDLERIREAAERVARSEGLDVVEVEWKVGKQRFLRVTIDRPQAPASSAGAEAAGAAPEQLGGAAPQGGINGGISHSDCERVSQQLSVILDVEDLVPGPRYILEVSSPGLDRKLLKPEDFERFKGRLAKISTAEPIGDAKFFEGRLAGYVNGMVRMELKGRDAKTVEVPFAAIRKASLVVEF
jgi:ribosome maturation factor RimP